MLDQQVTQRMAKDKNGIIQPDLELTKEFRAECVKAYKTGTDKLMGYKISILDSKGMVKYQLPYFRGEDPFSSPDEAWEKFTEQCPIGLFQADHLEELIKNPYVGKNFRWS